MTENIFGFIFLLIAHAAAGIYSSTLKYSKRTTFTIWGIWVLIQSALLVIAELLTDTVLQFVIGFVLSLAGQYAIFFLTTKGRILHRIFIISTYSIFFCITMTLFTMIRGTFADLHPVIILLIQAGMLFAIVTYFINHICSLCNAAAKNITTGWRPLIFANIVFMITVIFSSVFPIRLTSFNEPAFLTFVFICASIMAVYPVIFSNINSMSEAAMKREVEAQNKLLLAQIDAEHTQIMADSQARHDRRHHNLVLLELANSNDIESVKEYLSNLVKSDSEIFEKVRYCDNVTVNTVLTVYARQAKERGIDVKISANVARDIAIPPQDLVVTIANLFENAINATQKLKESNKSIDISIKENSQRLLIKVENSCNANMDFDESFYGIGIHSVIATANKYDGMYDFTVENAVFSAKVSLNI